MQIRTLLLNIALFAAGLHAQAKIALPAIYTDSMVVQQQSKITIPGKATPNSIVRVTASWNGKTVSTQADANGTFTAALQTPKAGGPYAITFNDGSGKELTLRDILVGEVWLCSGQSNMEMPVGGWGKVQNYEQEIASANNDKVRLLQIAKTTAFSPQNDVQVNMGGWRTVQPKTVENFSALAYFYARRMQLELGVPVGVIDCTWGGTPAEAWTSLEGVKKISGFEQNVQMLRNSNFDAETIKKAYEKEVAEWTACILGSEMKVNPTEEHAEWPTMPIPGEWELAHVGMDNFDGIVWLQRTVEIPTAWAGKPLTLRLGMIDDEDVTYFNGVKIGEGSGYDKPRQYTVPASLVKAGKALVSIRMTDFMGNGGLCGNVSDVYIQAEGSQPIPLAGKWNYRQAADFSKMPSRPASPESSSFPSVLYNGMIHPLHSMKIKGVLWYQGCANVGRADQYSPLFRQLIQDWRRLWQEELPFCFVQLAGYLQPQTVQPESVWAALRQAQADALALPGTAMATAIDIGNPADIHPKNKQEVARRLSLLALRHTYGKSVVAEAPAVSAVEYQQSTVTVTFTGKVRPKEGIVNGFVVRTTDGTWHTADMRQKDDTHILLSAPSAIDAVKYNWADCPDGNLYGANDLPVVPFQNFHTVKGITQRVLHDGWRFRQGDSELWHPAEVPGNTHLDLMRNRIIEDPFFRLNERGVQWVDKEDWMYETTFRPSAAELAASNQDMVFKGLDTYADVYLNHQRICQADNMHREWRCNVKGILQEGDNLLEVYFHSPVKLNVPKFDALPYRHNTGPDHSKAGGLFDKTISPFARTAGYEYGWDWGPRLVTFGIWRPVSLETWSGTRIADVWYQQKDVTKQRAQLRTVVEIDVDSVMLGDIPAEVTITADGKPAAKTVTTLHPGKNTVTLDYTIRSPRLWWTNGLGKPNLTRMQASISIGSVCCDSVATLVGLRSLKLHNDKDRYGHNLYFELNGEPLYAKGSNMIPNDNFLSRVTDSTYCKVVKDAADVNMNIIRVWGGGIYEDDAFYRACDSLGILVWQDFMFACTTYEVDSAFLENIRQEAIYNVKRLRNHACMAVYTGNNEAQDVWFGWGNKKKYFDELGQGERVWKMQHQIFYEVLPEVVKEYGGGTPYRPSSPWAFENTPSDGINGDDHYWGVWHGGDPIEAYFDHHVRFESEYGFQSFPEYESVLRYNPDPRDHNIYSEVMMAHQNAGTYANRRIEEYMARDYPVPADFQQFLYMSQVLQADAVKTGMEAFRRDRPYCMGGIVWQLNDCWPVASWSSRDYYGRWKALHYVTRKAYDDILVSPRVTTPAIPLASEGRVGTPASNQVAALPDYDKGHNTHIAETVADGSPIGKVLELKLVNDRRSAARGSMRIQTLTLDGRKVYEQKRTLTLPKNSATDAVTLPIADILGGQQPEDVVFYITFDTGGKSYYNIAYPVRQKQMHYSPAHITRTVIPAADGYDITLSTDIFARAVFLKVKGIDHFFSDNYFDLLPGQSRTIHVRTSKPQQQFEQELEITSLGDVF